MKLGQAVLHSNAGAQVAGQDRPFLGQISSAVQTSFRAPNCLRVLASELSRTKAAPRRLCSSGSVSFTRASPTLWTVGPRTSIPGAANRSAIWLMPIASLASRFDILGFKALEIVLQNLGYSFLVTALQQ